MGCNACWHTRNHNGIALQHPLYAMSHHTRVIRRIITSILASE
jgi:hypothetical protein